MQLIEEHQRLEQTPLSVTELGVFCVFLCKTRIDYVTTICF